MRLFVLSLLIIFCNASIQLLPPDSSPPFDSVQPLKPVYKAWDLFERTSFEPQTPMNLRLATNAVFQDGCQMVYQSASNEPTLILVNQTAIKAARCLSSVHALEAADRLGLGDNIYMGIYGKEMYDVTYPVTEVQYSYRERPTTVHGLVIETTFVPEALKRGNATTYVQVLREPGIWNVVVRSSGFIALWIITLVLLILAFCYGSFHFIYPIWFYYYYTYVKKVTLEMPEGWVSPAEKQYWRPESSTLIRISSLYCLLAWIISWRYKSTPAQWTIFYSSLFTMIVAFCLIIYRWCKIVHQVQYRRFYTVLRIFALIEIGFSFVALGTRIVQEWYPYNIAFSTIRMAISNFVWQPSLVLLIATFCVTSFMFLRFLKSITMKSKTRATFRKITFVGIANLFLVLCFLISGSFITNRLGDDMARYIAPLIVEALLWVTYHSLIFYNLSIPVPKKSEIGQSSTMNNSGVQADADDFDEEAHELVLSVNKEDDVRTNWNEVALVGTPKLGQQGFRGQE